MTIAIHTGLLRHKATFQVNAPTSVPGGGEKDHWTDLVTTRGYMEKLSGGLLLDAGDRVLNNRWRFTCWSSGSLRANMSKSLKVIINSRSYTIDSFTEVDGKQFWYEIILKEKE